MAFNFPSNPTAGQIYGNYTYNATTNAWDIISFSDGIPAGVIMAWGASSAPANWLICDGAAVSRSIYASLFNAIGTTYGVGDGSTTFNLPDLRGRVPVGKNGATFGTLGLTGGAETHILDISQIPSHNHGGSTNTTGAHTHSLSGKINVSQNGYGQNSPINGNAGNFADGTALSAGDHSHTISSQGGGQAHNNLQPYVVTNYIIKYSAANTPGDSELATRVGAIETTTVRSVNLGGTGASSLASGGYLKGAGTAAITSQAGIPAADITSGTLASARLPSGTVLQVVDYGTGANTAAVSGQYSWGSTGISATITPMSTSSRIKVSANITVSCSTAGWVFMRVLRNSTPVGNGTSGGTLNFNTLTYITDYGRLEPMNASFVDSPSTTSATTYTIQFAVYTGTGYLNRRGADALFGSYSNIVLEEIA